MKYAVRVYYNGTVQGIFFRQFIKQNADRLTVKGFARNLEDGRVEAWFEGDAENVRQMIEICRTGHRNAKVTGFEIKEEKFQGLTDFKVL